jgi:hypothetical protein
VVDYKAYLDSHSSEAVHLEPQRRAKKPKKSVPRGLVSAGEVVLASDPDSENEDSEGDSTSKLELSGNVDDPSKDCFKRLLDEISKKYSMEGIEDLLLLCPARIPGYGLREKEWGWMLIDGLQPVKCDNKAFESLQMDETTKSLIETLVKGHRSGRLDDFDDVITSKGKGLVLLLHG